MGYMIVIATIESCSIRLFLNLIQMMNLFLNDRREN